MKNLQSISEFSIWILLFFAACSSKTPKSLGVKNLLSDTSFTVRTDTLKSCEIPTWVFEMKNLKHLALEGMDCDYGDDENCWMLGQIPREIRNLKKLTTFSYSLSRIETIPIELIELKNLKVLDLSDNPGLSNVENVAQIQSLEQLYLYGCNLTKLPDRISNLKNLKYLGLVGNWQISKTEKARIKKALPNCRITY